MASHTGGVKAFPIAGRTTRERERLLGMTDEERAWRRQWLKDQELTHREPVHVPEIEKELRNPIRRFYRKPLDVTFKALEPVLGPRITPYARYLTGKFFIFMFGVYAGVYYFKYNANDWTRKGGWHVFKSNRKLVPGDPGYPKVETRAPPDYYDRGFKNSPI